MSPLSSSREAGSKITVADRDRQIKGNLLGLDAEEAITAREL